MSEPWAIRRATRASQFALIVVALAFAALCLGPLWLDRNGLRLASEFLVYLSLASLWNLLAGYAGLVSVGQQAYVGLGGYVLFAWATLLGLPPLLAVPAAGVAGALAAFAVSFLVFRLRGAYFAIGSWVVAEVFMLVAAQISALGGGSGVSLPIAAVRAIGATRDARDAAVFLTTLAVSATALLAVYLLLRSRWGLALQAIRDNETAARSSGVRVETVKRLVYVGACCGAAMLGAAIFLAKLRISPSAAFSVNDWTAFVIFITVIGGVGRLEGPLVGTALFFLLRENLSFLGAWYLLILGVIAVLVMLFAPRGLWGLVADRLQQDLLPIGRRLVFARDAASSKPKEI
ncbi:MAG TPA: branched-chain amino acid ABC transporter permease [Beijerinckiaceae bacterium]|jgi:branched-chain amino acid transport system permease protein